MCALKGRLQDFVVAGLLWVLIAIIGTYGIFSVMGILTGNSLGEMLQLQGERRIYASVVAVVVKFSMGKIAAIFFRRRDGIYKEENRIVASAFVFMTLLAMGLFWLEAGNPENSVRYVLTIGILLDEVGIIVFLVQLYQRLGRYQKEKIEAQYQREREQERLEGLMDIYRVGREINHWRHDMQGELDVLYRMQKNGKYEEVETHMERLCSGLRDYPELPQSTGNEGLDVATKPVIGQLAIPGKTNEMTAIPELLSMPEIEGSIITVDATGATERIMKEIHDDGADFLLQVKGNCPGLFREIKSLFEGLSRDKAVDKDKFERKYNDKYSEENVSEKNRDRYEHRFYQAFYDPGGLGGIQEERPYIESIGLSKQVRIKVVQDVYGNDITPGRCALFLWSNSNIDNNRGHK